jgi:hypothetical protein
MPLATLLLAVGLATAHPAHPANTVPQVALAVGQTIPFNPGELPATVICDDLTILRVEDEVDHFEVVGLKPGATLCSFAPPSLPGIRRVYRFVVTP